MKGYLFYLRGWNQGDQPERPAQVPQSAFVRIQAAMSCNRYLETAVRGCGVTFGRGRRVNYFQLSENVLVEIPRAAERCLPARKESARLGTTYERARTRMRMLGSGGGERGGGSHNLRRLSTRGQRQAARHEMYSGLEQNDKSVLAAELS